MIYAKFDFSSAVRLLLLVITLFLLVVLASPHPKAWAETDPDFEPLIKKLTKAGFEKEWVEEIFGQDCVGLNPKTLLLRLTLRESKLDYDQFLNEDNINKAQNFFRKYQETLTKAEEESGVPGRVIVAVMLLETKLGEYTGSFQTLSTLAGHAVAGHTGVVEKVVELLPEDEKERWTVEKARKRLGNRSKWAFNELKAYLALVSERGLDTCRIKGSYTGAIGLCQFQPSNIKPYGRDGNGDGLVDLFQADDAIVSVAEYLKRHGWKKNSSAARQLAVIKTYNNSTPYAKTILAVAEKLAQ